MIYTRYKLRLSAFITIGVLAAGFVTPSWATVIYFRASDLTTTATSDSISTQATSPAEFGVTGFLDNVVGSFEINETSLTRTRTFGTAPFGVPPVTSVTQTHNFDGFSTQLGDRRLVGETPPDNFIGGSSIAGSNVEIFDDKGAGGGDRVTVTGLNTDSLLQNLADRDKKELIDFTLNLTRPDGGANLISTSFNILGVNDIITLSGLGSFLNITFTNNGDGIVAPFGSFNGPRKKEITFHYDTIELSFDELDQILPEPPVSAVPVPAALPLMAAGLAGFGFLARRRSKQA